MFQRALQHPSGRFRPCRACGSEPRHIRNYGRTSREPVQFGKTPERHSLECRCGARTSLQLSLESAETEWGTDYAQLPLPLRTPRRKREAA
jgi:hypothetical protein